MMQALSSVFQQWFEAPLLLLIYLEFIHYLHGDVMPSFNKFTGSGGPQMVNQCRDHRFNASSLHMQNPSSGATGFVFEDSIWFWF